DSAADDEVFNVFSAHDGPPFCHQKSYVLARTPAFQDSPNDQSAIPSRGKSLRRNCPGFPERAGKPPALGSHTPGVVTRKLRVVRTMPTASALPTADARGDNVRAAMRSAMLTSTTPSRAEKPRTLISSYTQFISGLLVTYRRMPSAS